jgi:hypothetical protein
VNGSDTLKVLRVDVARSETSNKVYLSMHFASQGNGAGSSWWTACGTTLRRSSRSSIVRSRARIACLLAVIVVALVAVPVAQAAPGPKYNPPKSVYLALGDSLAFGY